MQPPKSACKDRALRVRPDYLKSGDWLRRGKHWLGGLAALAACAYGAWAWKVAPAQLSPGEVASPHAMWNDDCAACHVPFSPARADSVAWFADCAKDCNAKCTKCHAGEAHHDNLSSDREFSCAVCHREHQGRDAMLTHVEDRACTECHGNLNAAGLAKSPPTKAATITSFAAGGGHPEFASLKSDPGKLKFSHQRHMTLGQVRPNSKDTPKKLADLPEDVRKYYVAGKDAKEGEVQLDCASCHQSSAASEQTAVVERSTDALVAATITEQSTAGAYMLPINYERHCSACHPTTWRPGIAQEPSQPPVKTYSIRHGLPPGEIERELKEAVLDALVSKTPAKFDEEIPVRRVPGRAPEPDGFASLESLRQEKFDAARNDLRHDCSLCHVKGDGAPLEDVTRDVIDPAIPAVWFKNAKFDHAAHRGVSCESCHSQPYEKWDGTGSALDHTAMMIPTMKVCTDCHAPRHVDNGRTLGGARFDCAECHRYHQVDRHPADSDRWRHRFDAPRNVDQFLRAAQSAKKE